MFVASTRSPVEMRAMQSRVIDGDAETVARGVVATLQDLGYRITRVDPASGTVAATKAYQLRVSAVIREAPERRSVVRANAAVAAQGRVHEVDSPEFYQRNFFVPLTEMLGREAFAVAADAPVPDAVPTAAPDTSPQPGVTPNTRTTR